MRARLPALAVLPVLPVLSLLALLPACGGEDKGPQDRDGDGYDSMTDCNDFDASVGPDAVEVCNGIDDDCDGKIDDEDPSLDASTGLTWFFDGDGDGYGATAVQACLQPAGTVAVGGDCEDGDAAVNPAATEVCNGIDDDCDGTVDLGAADAGTWYADADGDGYSAGLGAVQACTAPAGSVELVGDCDDTDSQVHPGAVEGCDGRDDDCDPTTTEDGLATWEGEDGSVEDWSARLAGDEGTPLAVAVPAAGTLSLCPGTWDATVAAQADLTVVGVGEGVVLRAEGAGAGLWTRTDGITLSVRDLSIMGGAGVMSTGLSTTAGGGLSCEADSALVVDHVELSGGSADLGGGLFSLGCDTTLSDVLIHDTTASTSGGGALLMDGAHDWTRVTVRDADGGEHAGGVDVQAFAATSPIPVSFTDVRLDGNQAAGSVSGMRLVGADLDWAGSTAGAAGLVSGNDPLDPFYGALWVGTGSSARFDNVDFGTAAGGDDNATVDLTAGLGLLPYEAGDGATFQCDSEGCGSPVEQGLGSTGGTEYLDGYIITDVVQASDWGTLSSLWVDLNSSGTCTVDLVVFSAAAPSTHSWVLERDSGPLDVPTSGGVRDDGLALLAVPGRYYALGAAVDCSSGTANDAYGSGGPTDAGFGRAVGFSYSNSYVLGDSLDTWSADTYGTSYRAPYHLSVTVTRL